MTEQQNFDIDEQLGATPAKEYVMYDGGVRLFYAEEYEGKSHVYYRDTPEGRVIVPHATGVTGLIDKSPQLIAWAVKLCVDYLRERTVGKNNVTELEETWIPPSVTVWDELLKEAKSQHRTVKKTATDIGQMAHAWMEAYGRKRLLGYAHHAAVELVPMPENEKAKLCVEAALKWLVEHHVEPIEVERKVYSVELDTAGTMDWVGFVDGKRSIIDFKSSKGLYDEYLYQIAFYRAAYEEETGMRIDQCILLKLGKEDGDFDTRTVDNDDDYLADLLAFRGLLLAYNRIQERDAMARKLKAETKAVKDAEKAILKAAKQAEKDAAKAAKKLAKASPATEKVAA